MKLGLYSFVLKNLSEDDTLEPKPVGAWELSWNVFYQVHVFVDVITSTACVRMNYNFIIWTYKLSTSNNLVHMLREKCAAVLSQPVHRTATDWEWRYQMLH